MVSKIRMNHIIYIIIIIVAIGIVANIIIDFSPKKEEKEIFPGILGDLILKNNETGIYFIKDIISYDNFRGDVVQGYKANYTGRNGTMIIFMAQMKDNISANKSLRDMVIRLGYNQSSNNLNLTYNNIIKLPVENPNVFVIQRNNTQYHYTFHKEDKIYWIGFNNVDVQYQIDMLMEVYKYIDKRLDNEYTER